MSLVPQSVAVDKTRQVMASRSQEDATRQFVLSV